MQPQTYTGKSSALWKARPTDLLTNRAGQYVLRAPQGASGGGSRSGGGLPTVGPWGVIHGGWTLSHVTWQGLEPQPLDPEGIRVEVPVCGFRTLTVISPQVYGSGSQTRAFQYVR